MKRKDIFETIRIHLHNAETHDNQGRPNKAVIENRKAIKLLDKLKEVLENNEGVFEMHSFLMRGSNITRPPKKVKRIKQNEKI